MAQYDQCPTLHSLHAPHPHTVSRSQPIFLCFCLCSTLTCTVSNANRNSGTTGWLLEANPYTGGHGAVMDNSALNALLLLAHLSTLCAETASMDPVSTGCSCEHRANDTCSQSPLHSLSRQRSQRKELCTACARVLRDLVTMATSPCCCGGW